MKATAHLTLAHRPWQWPLRLGTLLGNATRRIFVEAKLEKVDVERWETCTSRGAVDGDARRDGQGQG